MAHTGALKKLKPEINDLGFIIANSEPNEAVVTIKLLEKKLAKIAGANRIKARLSKARRFMKKTKPKRDRAGKELEKALIYYAEEISWRSRANRQLSQDLSAYDIAIRDTIGLRQQERLTEKQAEAVASCQSIHRDISLDF